MGGVGAVAGPLGWLPPRLGLRAPSPGAVERRLRADAGWLSARQAALQLPARWRLCSALGLPPRVGSETSAAAEAEAAAAAAAAAGRAPRRRDRGSLGSALRPDAHRRPDRGLLSGRAQPPSPCPARNCQEKTGRRILARRHAEAPPRVWILIFWENFFELS